MIQLFIKRSLVLAMFLSLFVACSSEITPVQAENSNTDTNAQTDAVADVIQLEDGNFLVEGDMIFTAEQLVSSNVLKKDNSQSAILDLSVPAWEKNAVIEYYFAPVNNGKINSKVLTTMNTSAKREFARALKDLSNGVAISFKEVSTPSEQTVWIYTYLGEITMWPSGASGCATVGNIGKNSTNFVPTRNKIQLSVSNGGLSYTVFMHEMSHILGFVHEHQRPYREQYVIIKPENAGDLTNYGVPASYNTLNTSFDMASIMLYRLETVADEAAYDWVGVLPLQSKADQSARKTLFGSEPSDPNNYYIQHASGKYLCRSTTGTNASLLLNTTKSSLCIWDITTGTLNLGQTSQYSGIVLDKNNATTIRSTETTYQGFGIYLSHNSADNTVGLSVQGGGIQYASKWIPIKGVDTGDYVKLWNPLGNCLVVRYNEVTVNNRPCSEKDVLARITHMETTALGSQYLWNLIPTWNTKVPY